MVIKASPIQLVFVWRIGWGLLGSLVHNYEKQSIRFTGIRHADTMTS